MDDFTLFLPIEKMDEEKRMVWGYASTPTKDLQGEIITLDAIKAALPDYMQWANIREMHTSSAVGVAKEANVDKVGLYLGAHVVDDNAWLKCKEKVYKGFSIGGQKIEKQGDTINKLKLIEISLVDRPANPDCRIEVIKVAAALPLVGAEGSLVETMFGKLMDMGKDLIRLAKGGDGLSRPAGRIAHPSEYARTPAEYARDGWQPRVIPAAVDTLDPHPTNAMILDLRTPGASTPHDEEIPLTPAERMDLERKCAAATPEEFIATAADAAKRAFSEKERKHLASTGAALPDGSFPIQSMKDVENAVHAVGRSADPEKAKAHIIARAKALNATHLLPADWPGSTQQEKAAMDTDLLKRMTAMHKAAMGKAKMHMEKAMMCHGKCMAAMAKMAGMMGKADGMMDKDMMSKHLAEMGNHMGMMGDHMEMAGMHMAKAMKGMGMAVGEPGLGPTSAEGGDVSQSNVDSVDMKPSREMTEGMVEGSDLYAGDSPYAASAMLSSLPHLIENAVLKATQPLKEELATQKGMMSILERMPSTAGPRPRLYGGMEKGDLAAVLTGDSTDAVNQRIAKNFHDATTAEDPDTAIRATARIIGERALNPGLFGKRITDSDYKGAAGR